MGAQIVDLVLSELDLSPPLFEVTIRKGKVWRLVLHFFIQFNKSCC